MATFFIEVNLPKEVVAFLRKRMFGKKTNCHNYYANEYQIIQQLEQIGILKYKAIREPNVIFENGDSMPEYFIDIEFTGLGKSLMKGINNM